MDKLSFAEIYSKWESFHDEDLAIEKRISSSEKQFQHKVSISELRRMKVQDELDLHSFLLDEALKETKSFIAASAKRGLKKIRIVTGKGLHSPNCEAVLRPAIIGLVKSSALVREYDLNPKPEDGGSGAIILILR